MDTTRLAVSVGLGVLTFVGGALVVGLLESGFIISLVAGLFVGAAYYNVWGKPPATPQLSEPERRAAVQAHNAMRHAQRFAPLLKVAVEKYRSPVNILSVTDSGAAIEIQLLIGEAVNSYQQLVIIPYHRAADAEYWQEVAAQVINGRGVA